jgi:hypothetical protein
MNKIAKAIKDLRPGAEWTLLGDSYDDINWLDKVQEKPTLKEINAAIKNPLPEPEISIEDKLSMVGLSIQDLKTALGL